MPRMESRITTFFSSSVMAAIAIRVCWPAGDGGRRRQGRNVRQSVDQLRQPNKYVYGSHIRSACTLACTRANFRVPSSIPYQLQLLYSRVQLVICDTATLGDC